MTTLINTRLTHEEEQEGWEHSNDTKIDKTNNIYIKQLNLLKMECLVLRLSNLKINNWFWLPMLMDHFVVKNKKTAINVHVQSSHVLTFYGINTELAMEIPPELHKFNQDIYVSTQTCICYKLICGKRSSKIIFLWNFESFSRYTVLQWFSIRVELRDRWGTHHEFLSFYVRSSSWCRRIPCSMRWCVVMHGFGLYVFLSPLQPFPLVSAGAEYKVCA